MTRRSYPPRRPTQRKKAKSREGASYTHLLIAFIGVALLVTVSISAVRHYRNLAYGLAAQHALGEFVSAQQRYFLEYGRYAGTEGDFVEGTNPPTSAFPAGFDVTPSEGVRIVVISGDGARPTQAPSFKAKATHEKTRVQFVYDFATHSMEESEAQP